MRVLFLFILSAFLVTSCNSDTLGDKASKKDKPGKFDEDDIDGGGGGDNGRSNWTKKDRNKWLDECETQLGDKGKEICSCVLAKVERKYPDPSDAENATEAEGARFAKECLGGGKTDDYNTDEDNDDYSRDDRDDRRTGDDDGGYTGVDDNDNDRNTGGRWTTQQRQSYIQGCATTAVQSGLTRAQANSYCSCMVGKLEQKVNFQVASRMTEADFRAAEWQEAAIECRPNF